MKITRQPLSINADGLYTVGKDVIDFLDEHELHRDLMQNYEPSYRNSFGSINFKTKDEITRLQQRVSRITDSMTGFLEGYSLSHKDGPYEGEAEVAFRRYEGFVKPPWYQFSPPKKHGDLFFPDFWIFDVPEDSRSLYGANYILSLILASGSGILSLCETQPQIRDFGTRPFERFVRKLKHFIEGAHPDIPYLDSDSISFRNSYLEERSILIPPQGQAYTPTSSSPSFVPPHVVASEVVRTREGTWGTTVTVVKTWSDGSITTEEKGI